LNDRDDELDDEDELDEGAWHRARWLADAEDEAAGIAGREEH
jgi:hypothetical protein